MRRIKLVVGVGVVMAAILALSAGPAMADEWDGHWNEWDGHHGSGEVLWLAEGTAAYDQWCSPGLPDHIWIPGCIFSDVEDVQKDEEEIVFIEHDDFFDDLDDEEVVFLFEVDEDDFFDHDDDHDGDHDGDRKRRNHRG